VRGLEPRFRDVAVRVAEVLASGGHRGWIVGGAVRDLALERPVSDVDMTSAAHPDEVERLFEHTVPVGREFGTVVVLVDGAEVQHTTFRGESDYADARRPDRVEFGRTLEEDAHRRDFTCNALFLDPLADEVADPTGGLADLEAGVLRCVGEARERFAEDGLRLLRLARFAGALDLEVEEGTLAGARAAAGALGGVSPERIRQEFASITKRPGAHRAVSLLAEIGLLAPALTPGDDGWCVPEAERLARLARLDEPVGLERGLALLLQPAGDEQAERGAKALEDLRLSRAEQTAVRALWSGLGALRALDAGRRAPRVRLARRDDWAALRSLALTVPGCEAAAGEVEALRRAATKEELNPAPLLSSDDLAASALPRGPEWGRALADAEELQLEGELADREAALAWLKDRAPDAR
jgi:tRNA nucleotidyltransferase/poly(A) polymerase